MNNRFLDVVAQDIFRKHDGRLDNVLLLFPSRRNILFFRKSLAGQADRPIWAPKMFTLDGWIHSLMDYHIPDELTLLIKLHACWERLSGPVAFESFYGLGQIIMQDFEKMDKGLVDTKQFFGQIASIPSWSEENFTDMEPELEALAKAIRKNDMSIPIQTVWQNMGPLYQSFRTSLQSDHSFTSGMAIRTASETYTEEFHNIYDAVYAIGFYQLSASEMSILSKISSLHYYWNVPDEALHKSLDWIHPEFNWISGNASISTIIPIIADKKELYIGSASGNQNQLQALAQMLSSHGTADLERIGILLPDQGLLLPLLQSLPESIQNINVSMGLSVLDTTVYSLMQRFVSLLQSWKETEYVSSVSAIHFFEHPLFKPFKQDIPAGFLSSQEHLYWELHTQWNQMPQPWRTLLGPCQDAAAMLARCMQLLEIIYKDAEDELDRAAIYFLYTALRKLSQVLQIDSKAWSAQFFNQMLRRIFQNSRITLQGEPLKGLQVLGNFEMANLQFDELIVLQMNEGMLPSVSYQSVIPFTLCRVFGLPDIAYQTSIQEHLLYSHISKADKVHLFYNTESSGLGGAQPSRWLQRFLLDLHPEKWTKHRQAIHLNGTLRDTALIQIKDPVYVHSMIKKWMEHKLSITAISTWLTCRLKFFLLYAMKYQERNGESEEMDAGAFGNIVHAVMEKLYDPYIGKSIDAQDLTEMKTKVQGMVITEYMRYFKIPSAMLRKGAHLMFKETTVKAVNRLLDLDSAKVPFVLRQTEEILSHHMSWNQVELSFFGKVDRITITQDNIQILDYKTGSYNPKGLTASYEKYWLRDGKSSKEALQTTYYTWLFHKSNPEMPIPEAHLHYSKLQKSGDNTQVKPSEIDRLTETFLYKFEQDLLNQLQEMLRPDIVIDQTQYVSNCAHCPYKDICSR